MFLALRDLRHAKGRFALMIVVLVLVTFLVTFLASLTAGLGAASTSAITGLRADHIALALPGDSQAGFTDSQVTRSQWQAWAKRPGVTSAEPLGIATVRATSSGTGGSAGSPGAGEADGAGGRSATTAAVTAFGVDPGSSLVPDGAGAQVENGTVVLSQGAASSLDARTGQTLQISGATYSVAAVVARDADYAHTPVVWISLGAWQALGAHGSASAGSSDADAAVATGDPGAAVATAIALTTHDADLTAADAAIGTTTMTPTAARSAVSSFTAENLSLTVMQAFLLAISALVVGAFFTVWTINRAGDLAVLKALGGPTGYLLRDALSQALVVLVLGVGVGAGLAALAATAAAHVMPIVVAASTTLLPAVLLVLLGMVGAAAATVRITRIDPHAALAAR
jgi:putative ABC transport system permease protein